MKNYDSRYTDILRDELLVAMGCTEPIAIAYAAAYARQVLEKMPERMEVHCSGNLIKNAKAVTVPGTGGLRGIAVAAIAGAVSGRADLKLEVISVLTDSDREEINRLLEKNIVSVEHLPSEHTLHVVIDAYSGEDNVSVEIIDTHTGIGNVIKNGKYLKFRADDIETADEEHVVLTIEKIYEYANNVELDEVRELLERQISYNKDISNEGMTNPWGEQVGKAVLSMGDFGVWSQLIAAAAAGSDARMNGCTKPVVINSGSGNQGMTVSLPIIKYVEIKELSHEELLRALSFANLIAIHEKEGIGKLSAYCGAVCAAAASACGVAYLDGQPLDLICNVLTNALGTISGMVCDGAKSSCAAKIATALYCALLGYTMAKSDCVFRDGEGIVKPTIEETITTVGRLAAEGMRSTDEKLLGLMLDK